MLSAVVAVLINTSQKGNYHVEQNIGIAGYTAGIPIQQGFINSEEIVARLRQSNQRKCHLAGVPCEG